MNDLFFYSSKIIWMVISPDSLFVLILISAWVFLLLGKHKLSGVLLTMVSIAVLTLNFLPIGSWMLHPLETRFQHNPVLPERIDGIMVLGGSIQPEHSAAWQQLETNSYHERLSAFIELARIYPEAQLVFSGGNASLIKNKPTEAEIAQKYFISHGIDPARLVIEDKARNTAENAAYAQQLVQPENDENWVLITTAYHMPRSVGLFCQLNWATIPYPVDHVSMPEIKWVKSGFLDNMNDLVVASHEWTGLLAYFLTGKTPAFLPNTCLQEDVYPVLSNS